MDGAAAYGYILGQMCSNAGGTSQKPFCGCQIDSRGLPGYGHWFAVSRPVAAAHKEAAADYPPKKVQSSGICEKRHEWKVY